MANHPQIPWTEIGRVADAQGIKGEVFVAIPAGEAPWLKDLKTCSLGPSNQGKNSDLSSFQVLKAREHRKGQKFGLVLALEGVVDRNTSETLKGQAFFIPTKFLETKSQNNFYLREILDFLIRDLNTGIEGQIVGFSHNGAQDLLVVSTRKGEFDVPLVQDFIERIDYDKGLVLLKLPLGLLSLGGEEE